MTREKDIINWAEKHKIFEKSNPLKQITKTQEELTETRDAIVAHKSRNPSSQADFYAMLEGVKDGIGDQVVTLVILAKMHGLTLEECVEHAWNEIKDRTGEMKNGLFVKKELHNTGQCG